MLLYARGAAAITSLLVANLPDGSRSQIEIGLEFTVKLLVGPVILIEFDHLFIG